MNINKKKTILITGGAGFIGSHLCEKYLREGNRVIAMDNLQTTFDRKNIEKFFSDKNFKFIKHDIIKPISIPEKIDWIFNFACSGSPTNYQFDPVHTTKTNTQGAINLLELAKKNNARIMQASTSEVYGDPHESPQRETYSGNVSTLGPRACYDEGKRCAETLFMDYYREYGVDIKIIRIFNTYGTNMDVNDGRAISNFIANALEDKDIVIYGDGSQTRSFQYIDDLVSGIDAMMNSIDFIGPVNLGNPGEVTILDIAKIIINKTDSGSQIIFKEKVTDDPQRRCPDITLAKETLGWEPKVSLDSGLDKTIEYFKSVERPEKKIMVFSTTYYPDLGPAEAAIYELSKEMPDVEFHIITTKFRGGRLSFERKDNNFIYRVGLGITFDKYLLPILGVIKAYKINKINKFRFAWSVMASYGGLSALAVKTVSKNINFLLTIDSKELENRSFVKGKMLAPFYKVIFSNADRIYVSDFNIEKKAKIISRGAQVSVVDPNSKSFVDYIKYSFADIVNRQEKKLSRPK